MRGRAPPPLYEIVMSNKDKYRLLCNTEKNIPIFSHDWWLDTVAEKKNGMSCLLEQKGKIQATLPLYVPPFRYCLNAFLHPNNGPLVHRKFLRHEIYDRVRTTSRTMQTIHGRTKNAIRTSCKISIMTSRIGFRFIGRDITKRHVIPIY